MSQQETGVKQTSYHDRLTLAVIYKRRRRLKQYAAKQGKTMTDIVSQWIDEYCGREN